MLARKPSSCVWLSLLLCVVVVHGAPGDAQLRSTIVNGEVVQYYACTSLSFTGCPGVVGMANDVVCPSSVYFDYDWWTELNLTSLPPGESVCMCSHSYSKKHPDTLTNCTGFLGDVRAECLTASTGCGQWGLGTYIWIFDGIVCGGAAFVMMCQGIGVFFTLKNSAGGIKMDSTTTTLIFVIGAFFGQLFWFGSYPFIVSVDSGLYFIYEKIGIPFASAFTTLHLLNASLMWVSIVQSSKRLKASGTNLKGPYKAIVITFCIVTSGSICFIIYVLYDLTLASAVAGLWLFVIAIIYFIASCQLEGLRKMIQGNKDELNKNGVKKKKRHGIGQIVHVARRTGTLLIMYLLVTAAYVMFPKTNTPLALNGNPVVLFFLFSSLLSISWSILSYVKGVIINKTKKSRVAPSGSSTQVTSVG